MPRQIAYISFDRVPAPKVAATHILAFARALAAIGEVHLVSVSLTSEVMTLPSPYPGIHHIALPAVGETLIDHVLCFRRHLLDWWQGKYFDVIHIRSIYEGFPIALRLEELSRALVFEVNGLPSIELNYRYPRVANDGELLDKLQGQEAITRLLKVYGQLLPTGSISEPCKPM
jgi:hypothetical protein